MESSLNPETSGFSDDPLGAPSATSSSLSRALWQYIFREDRFFLVLGVHWNLCGTGGRMFSFRD